MLIGIVCSGVSLFTLANIFLKNVTADWQGAEMFVKQQVVSGSTIQGNVFPNCIRKCSWLPSSRFQKWFSSNSCERTVYDSLLQIEWFILRRFRAWECEFYNLLWAPNDLHSTCRSVLFTCTQYDATSDVHASFTAFDEKFALNSLSPSGCQF